MKKSSIILIALLLLSLPSFSQEKQVSNQSLENVSEIKLNGILLILGVFEPSYEFILNEESAIGISAFLPFDKDVTDEIKYYISPYYRMYFGNKNNASGFFGEAFGMLNNSNREFDLFDTEEDNFKTDFALGFGFGGKWVNKRGFIFELSMGIGRNLFYNDDDDPLVGKGGITLGYRF
ncbi:hypothetical protein [Seonamhaeicola sp.]|uniref:hypothetical protein n=1 Tax=Seonamhaeicola sp. TaxID=1912245 RepID=UPI002615872A|nr:hypothetical protein [Seonamhaeicola sp.]